MMPACELGWEALHLSTHTNGLCAAQERTDYHSEHSTSGQKQRWSRVGGWQSGGRGGGCIMAATFQSIWINSDWASQEEKKKWLEHLAAFSTAPAILSAVDIKAACRYKGVSLF